MATLQKIRNRGPLLVIIVGLALFAFIAGDVLNSIQSAANESRQQIGEVYGEKISVHEFQNLVDEYSEVVKFTMGNASLNDAQMTQLRDQVWNTYVNGKLIAHEAGKLGLTVTDAEVQAVITEGTNPILMQTPKAASELLLKLLKSAAANAENNHQMDPEKLYVSQVFACPGPIIKRMRPRAQGRAYRINKRTSHITICVAER